MTTSLFDKIPFLFNKCASGISFMKLLHLYNQRFQVYFINTILIYVLEQNI